MSKIVKAYMFNRKERKRRKEETAENNLVNDEAVHMISSKIEDNKEFITKNFKNSNDVIIYEFQSLSGVKAMLVYIENMVDRDVLNRDVITPFIDRYKDGDVKKILRVAMVEEKQAIPDISLSILNASTALFVDGMESAFIIYEKKYERRTVTEPPTEVVVRGPREGFIENISVNITLIRRKIKNTNLMVEKLTIGRQTKTNIALVYIDGIVNGDVLKELKNRLDKISTDSILDSGYIEQFIEDSPFSPMPTVGNTQKPDIAAGKLLEGRVAIICDGSPHVLTVPYLFAEGIQVSEDYYNRTLLASLFRMSRIIALLVSIFFPGLFIALETFHQEMIPTILLITAAGAREGIPFPAIIEALLVNAIFELLRESGARLPRPIGSATTIVGGLVLGEAAVTAGIITAPMVIVIGITALSTFVIAPLVEMITLYRFAFIILGGTFGLFGITCGIFAVVAQAVSLRSFGIPYTSVMAPANFNGMKDFILRFPLWAMKKRPESIVKENKRRRD